MRNFLRTPNLQMTLCLFLIFIIAFINNPSLNIVLTLFFALSSTLISNFIFIKIRRIPVFFSSATLVSGLIIALLEAFDLPWYSPVTAGVIAMASKNFLRISNKHVFNPAAFGLLVESFIFNHPVSWWGVSWQQFSIYFLILFSPFVISAIKILRYRIQLAFVGTSTLILLIMNAVLKYELNQPPIEALFSFIALLDPTIIFFIGVMLPEPVTTPSHHKEQIIFGTSVAILFFLLALFSLDPLIFSLLIGNFLYKLFKLPLSFRA